MASKQNKTLQECQTSNTSTEFMEWMYFFDMQWNERQREDFLFATIVAEIRSFKKGFSGGGSVSINDCLVPLKFMEDNSPAVESTVQRAPVIPVDGKTIEDLERELEGVGGVVKGGIITGPEVLKDPKWAATTASVKGAFAGWADGTKIKTRKPPKRKSNGGSNPGT